MNIFKLNKVYCLWMVLFLTMAVTMLFCKKMEPAKYSGENFVYFRNYPSGSADNAASAGNFYQSVTAFSNLISRFQVDTVYTNTNYVYHRFPLTIQTDGKLVGVNRKITLYVEGNGKEYCVLPNLDSIYIPANGTECKLNIQLVRPPLNDTTQKTITLWLKNNDQFSPEKHVWQKVTYKFGNWFQLPLYYSRVQPILGEFSPAKMQAIQAAVSKAGEAIWEGDPNLTLLNNYLPSINERKFDFKNFTYSELYYYCDITMYFASGIMYEAHNEVSRKIRSITNEYLLEMKDAGKPVLDESGVPVHLP